MKRIFYFVMATVLCVSACQKADPVGQTGRKGEVAFTVTLPGSIGTKAIADGDKALKLYYATYTDDGKMIPSLSNIAEGIAVYGKAATVKLQLVKHLNYDVVFWAQAEECKAFTFDWEKAAMTVDYKGVANDDYRDAFYAVRQNLNVSKGVFEETVSLYRPFAQINFLAADYKSVVEYYDQASVDAGMKSSLVSAQVPNTLNLLEESLEDVTAPLDFGFSVIPNDPRTLKVNGIDYKYVSMNYILAPKGKEPAMLPGITASFQYTEGNISRSIEVKNMPYLRNHRTNIIGNFFTESALLSIVIDQIFEKPDFNYVDPGVKFTQRKLDSLARIPNTSFVVPAGKWNLPAEIAEGVEFIGAGGTIINVGAKALPFKVGGSTQLVLDDTVIEASKGNAVSLTENADVEMIIVGTVNLTASDDAVHVPAGSKLTVSGYELIAKGGSGKDTSDGGGSGIGGNGTINLVDLNYITAEGYGKNGYGIGGAEAVVNITRTTVEYARGGYPQPLCDTDPKYGKSEPEGAPAIGGAVIVIDESLVESVDGGSKAAGIGARYWEDTDITISNSTVNAQGGNASAGIGGSRYSSGISASEKQVVRIRIENSTIEAYGGQFGAGIGSGYDTHCAANESNAVNDITIIKSVVKARGGKYAAGIGTGFHAAALTGSIDADSVIDAMCGEDFYKTEYTVAQHIGYGVVDPTREFKDAVVTFELAGKVIDKPKFQ